MRRVPLGLRVPPSLVYPRAMAIHTRVTSLDHPLGNGWHATRATRRDESFLVVIDYEGPGESGRARYDMGKHAFIDVVPFDNVSDQARAVGATLATADWTSEND